MQESINLTIKNNTSGNVPVSILGNMSNLADNANATTSYTYDVTTLVGVGFFNTVSIEYKATGQTFFTTYVATYTTAGTAQDIVNALNTLGIGEWFSYTSGASTYIANYNNNYIFGVFNAYLNQHPQCSYNVVATNISGQILVNAILVVTLSNANAQGTLNNPSATPIGGGLVNGDSVNLIINNLGFNYQTQIKNETSGVILFSSNGTTVNYSFTVTTGNNYSIEVYQF